MSDAAPGERYYPEQLLSHAVLTEDEKELGVCLIDIGGGTTMSRFSRRRHPTHAGHPHRAIVINDIAPRRPRAVETLVHRRFYPLKQTLICLLRPLSAQ